MLIEALRLARDTLYPRRCVHCGAFDGFLCGPCAELLRPKSDVRRCAFCSAPWEADSNCIRCQEWWRELDGCLAFAPMEGPARSLVHALKYRLLREVAPLMAERLRHMPDVPPFDAVFPVPLHRSRQRKRGFNQAEELLRYLDWPRPGGTLRRVRKTSSQVGRGFGDRQRNVSGAFTYDGRRLDGVRVALLDDVVTTGATAIECARVLRDAGARGVVVLAFARAAYQPDGRPDRIFDDD
ncbi:hypothetical protein AYO38_00030 [bacterium SCGC AG-212-C10]|nr:hypothetical protein AYO38_00030 [bacterium SCGC AG-212-C10]